jgi:hypothetical protein
MTLAEFKKKYLSLIEELNPKSPQLTDDPDIAAKQNEAINLVMFEMARIKKLPKYVEIPVEYGDLITLEDIGNAVGYDVYQVGTICGVKCLPKADGTVFKMLEKGTAEINVYVYPERITEKTTDKAYEFEIPAEVLEIMTYGVAAALLKSDVSAEYGAVYAKEYAELKQTLDPRYNMPTITFEEGTWI